MRRMCALRSIGTSACFAISCCSSAPSVPFTIFSLFTCFSMCCTPASRSFTLDGLSSRWPLKPWCCSSSVLRAIRFAAVPAPRSLPPLSPLSWLGCCCRLCRSQRTWVSRHYRRSISRFSPEQRLRTSCSWKLESAFSCGGHWPDYLFLSPLRVLPELSFFRAGVGQHHLEGILLSRAAGACIQAGPSAAKTRQRQNSAQKIRDSSRMEEDYQNLTSSYLSSHTIRPIKAMVTATALNQVNHTWVQRSGFFSNARSCFAFKFRTTRKVPNGRRGK